MTERKMGRAPRLPELDPRLATARDLTPPCEICADIGADHGRLSAVLLSSGRVKRMLVADVSAKALEKARKRLSALGLAERATFQVADGLMAIDALPGKAADAICILGMGGDTIAGILRGGRERLKRATLVLGPQTELPLVRQTLQTVDYRLRKECVAEASKRLYVLMLATPKQSGEAAYTEEELLLGPCLLRERPEEWQKLLRMRHGLLTKAQGAMLAAGLHKDRERLAETRRELAYVEKVLSNWRSV